MVNTYSLTEANTVTFTEMALGKSSRGTIGKSCDCEIQIVNDNRVPVSSGEEGELAIRGKTVMKGYLNDPGRTADVLNDGWFYTGDLTRNDEYNNLGNDSELCFL